MGSVSSGKFKDYPPSKGDDGPAGGEDRCEQDLRDVSLDEVGRSDYFRGHNSVPRVGTRVRLREATVGPRLSVDDTRGESVGFLPTEFNYLLLCMKRGFTYSGDVTASSDKPLPSVRVSLRARRT
jgi:hypothetical protein